MSLTLNVRSSIKNLLNEGKTREAAMWVLDAGRNKWDVLLNPKCDEDPQLDYSISQLSELEHEFDSLVQKAAMIAEYIGHRGTYGCGDSDMIRRLRLLKRN
jgi:hypothetical protein